MHKDAIACLNAHFSTNNSLYIHPVLSFSAAAVYWMLSYAWKGCCQFLFFLWMLSYVWKGYCPFLFFWMLNYVWKGYCPFLFFLDALL